MEGIASLLTRACCPNHCHCGSEYPHLAMTRLLYVHAVLRASFVRQHCCFMQDGQPGSSSLGSAAVATARNGRRSGGGASGTEHSGSEAGAAAAPRRSVDAQVGDIALPDCVGDSKCILSHPPWPRVVCTHVARRPAPTSRGPVLPTSTSFRMSNLRNTMSVKSDLTCGCGRWIQLGSGGWAARNPARST